MSARSSRQISPETTRRQRRRSRLFKSICKVRRDSPLLTDNDAFESFKKTVPGSAFSLPAGKNMAIRDQPLAKAESEGLATSHSWLREDHPD